MNFNSAKWLDVLSNCCPIIWIKSVLEGESAVLSPSNHLKKSKRLQTESRDGGYRRYFLWAGWEYFLLAWACWSFYTTCLIVVERLWYLIIIFHGVILSLVSSQNILSAKPTLHWFLLHFTSCSHVLIKIFAKLVLLSHQYIC